MSTIFENYELIIFDWEGTLAFSENMQDHLFPGVKNMLEVLSKNKKLAIATGKGEQSLLFALEQFNITQLFTVICSASNFNSKPDPAMLLHAMQETNIRAPKTLMVGDSFVDVAAANAAGVDSCLITKSNTLPDMDVNYVIPELPKL